MFYRIRLAQQLHGHENICRSRELTALHSTKLAEDTESICITRNIAERTHGECNDEYECEDRTPCCIGDLGSYTMEAMYYYL